jgi:hypothetical protein
MQNMRPVANLIIDITAIPIDFAARAFDAACRTRFVHWLIWKD